MRSSQNLGRTQTGSSLDNQGDWPYNTGSVEFFVTPGQEGQIQAAIVLSIKPAEA